MESQLRAIAEVIKNLDHAVRRLEALASSMERRLTQAESAHAAAISAASEPPPAGMRRHRAAELTRQYLPQLIVGLVASIIAVIIVVHIFSGGFSE